MANPKRTANVLWWLALIAIAASLPTPFLGIWVDIRWLYTGVLTIIIGLLITALASSIEKDAK